MDIRVPRRRQAQVPVRPKRDVPAVRAALERGRRVEALLLEEGMRLIESLRAEADAD